VRELHRRTTAVVALGLLPSIWAAWLLWLAPVEGLGADRTALAARDFTALWAAGQAAAQHSLAILASPVAFTDFLRAQFGPGIPAQIWPYPPPILLLAQPLAKLPLYSSFAVYSAAGLAVLWLATRLAELSTLARAAILVSPAVMSNALCGQNGTLIAALLCGGLLAIDRRPILAGALLGAVVIKPQFAFLLPFCLLAAPRRAALLSTGISSLSLSLLSVIVFGYQPWVEFFSKNRGAVSAYIGAPWQSDPAQAIFSSVFMAVRSLGGGTTAAAVVQAAASCCCAYFVWRLWRNPQWDARQRAAATIPLILLASPWVHMYDMPALAVSLALLLPGCTVPGRILIAIAWLWPGLSPVLTVPPLCAVLSIASVARFAQRGFGTLQSASA